MLGAVGLAVLAACVPATGPRTSTPTGGRGEVGAAPSPPPAPARSLDQRVTERMTARLAALTLALRNELRKQTGNSRLDLEPRDAWVDLVPPRGRGKRFTSSFYRGEALLVMAVSEHEGDRLALRLYNPQTGELVHRGDPTAPFDVVAAEVRGQMGIEAEMVFCQRSDGCAVALGVAVMVGAQGPGRGAGAPVSVPLDPRVLPPDFWRE